MLLMGSTVCTYITMQSTTSGDSGDTKTAKRHATISFVCTAVGWFVAVAGVAIIIGSIVAAVNATADQRASTFNNNFNSFNYY